LVRLKIVYRLPRICFFIFENHKKEIASKKQIRKEKIQKHIIKKINKKKEKKRTKRNTKNTKK